MVNKSIKTGPSFVSLTVYNVGNFSSFPLHSSRKSTLLQLFTYYPKKKVFHFWKGVCA